MRSQLSFEPHPFIRPPSRSRVYLCPFRGFCWTINRILLKNLDLGLIITWLCQYTVFDLLYMENRMCTCTWRTECVHVHGEQNVYMYIQYWHSKRRTCIINVPTDRSTKNRIKFINYNTLNALLNHSRNNLPTIAEYCKRTLAIYRTWILIFIGYCINTTFYDRGQAR